MPRGDRLHAPHQPVGRHRALPDHPVRQGIDLRRAPLREVFQQSAFLRDFRETAARHTRGCIVLERPDLLEDLAKRHGAKDTTARHAAYSEVAALETRPSQYNPGQEIPEKSFAYRIAKYFFFNDYGTYTQHFDAARWIDTREQPPPQPKLVQIG